MNETPLKVVSATKQIEVILQVPDPKLNDFIMRAPEGKNLQSITGIKVKKPLPKGFVFNAGGLFINHSVKKQDNENVYEYRKRIVSEALSLSAERHLFHPTDGEVFYLWCCGQSPDKKISYAFLAGTKEHFGICGINQCQETANCEFVCEATALQVRLTRNVKPKEMLHVASYTREPNISTLPSFLYIKDGHVQMKEEKQFESTA
jgi:hypothetical protein